jgi:polysaccharide biosynthesis protein PelF
VSDVALMTEGTYPYQFGGVSVWCDQLIRGMPTHDFHLVALVATGAERCVWRLPANVASVVTVPMWGSPPAWSRPNRRASPGFRLILADLLDVLLEPSTAAQSRFGDVLRTLTEYGRRENLTANFASEEAVALVSQAWHERGQQAWSGRSTAPQPLPAAMPTVHDAVIALQLLEHSLRPLSRPPVRADVLHAASNGLAVLPALTSKWRYETPMIITEHGLYLREQYLHGRNGPYRWPVKALYLTFVRRLCMLGYQEAAAVTPGNSHNRRWEERLGAEPRTIRTVNNGVNPADFPPLVGEPDVPTLSWLGRIDPVKDIDTLLRAFTVVHREMPEARLRLFGAPPQGRDGYLEHCRTTATSLGIGDTTTFEGRVDNARDAYRAGHVVVLSSISEGIPYSVIEAMTCGRPCVATDVGGVAEAVGDTGFVVPPRNPEAMARACLALLRDAELRHRLGAAARARALELFTVDRAISTFDEIYSLLRAGRPWPNQVPGNAVEVESAELLSGKVAG